MPGARGLQGATGPAGPGAQLFTSSGTYAVPAGVTRVKISAVGGGGQGATVVALETGAGGAASAPASGTGLVATNGASGADGTSTINCPGQAGVGGAGGGTRGVAGSGGAGGDGSCLLPGPSASAPGTSGYVEILPL